VRRRRGWTLLETLVALALVAFVGMATFSMVAGGFRLWERLREDGVQQRHVWLALEQMRQDLGRSRPFLPIPFKGTYDKISFPGPVPVVFQDPRSGQQWEAEEMGEIAYTWDSLQGFLHRSQIPYRFLRRHAVHEKGKVVSEGLRRIRFSYGKPIPGGGAMEWRSLWEEEEWPMAVKIEVEYQDGQTQRIETWHLVVPLSVRKP